MVNVVLWLSAAVHCDSFEEHFSGLLLPRTVVVFSCASRLRSYHNVSRPKLSHKSSSKYRKHNQSTDCVKCTG